MHENNQEKVPLTGGFYATAATYTLRRHTSGLSCFIQRNEDTGSERLMFASAPWYFQSDDCLAMVRCQPAEAAALEIAAFVLSQKPPGCVARLGGTASLYDVDSAAIYTLTQNAGGFYSQQRQGAPESLRVVARMDLRALQTEEGLPHTDEALRLLREAA
jgi:hypothetical protein